jgi:hypothetical protein
VDFEAAGQKVNGGFTSRSASDEHRSVTFGNPGVSELRAFIAAHRPDRGSPSTTIRRGRRPWSWRASGDLRLLLATPLLEHLKIAALVGVALMAIGAAVYVCETSASLIWRVVR